MGGIVLATTSRHWQIMNKTFLKTNMNTVLSALPFKGFFVVVAPIPGVTVVMLGVAKMDA